MADPLDLTQNAFVRRYFGVVAPMDATSKQTFVALMQARLRWEAASGAMQSGLRQLERAIRDATKDEPYAAEVASKTPLLFEMTDTLDSRLSDALDAALNASDPAERAKLHQSAKAILAEYVNYLNTAPIFSELDDNPFLPVTIRQDLSDALDDIARGIG